MKARVPIARTRARRASLRLAGRAADTLTRAIPDEVPSIPVLLRAIERGCRYFDERAEEILGTPRPETREELLGRVEGIVSAVAQAAGGALALLELLPVEVIELLDKAAKWHTIDPFGRKT